MKPREDKKRKAALIEGPLKKQITSMAGAMVFGMLGMIIFNLVDTIYVGRLGRNELAALSFTFPVVMVVHSLSLGIGIGLSSVLSRILGSGDHRRAARITTDGILLGLIIVALVVMVGQLTLDPLFRLLGARGEVLTLVKSYMRIWYFGSIAVVVPQVGNNALRATGDAKTPSMIMLASATMNALLDPLLIFGLGPFPALGVAGAALATVFSRATGFTVALLILVKREELVIFKLASLRETLVAWRAILYIGIPTALVRIIVPLSGGIITRLMAGFGTAAVAGLGVGTRIEGVALAFSMAVGGVIGPFVGQNLGARRLDRVQDGARYANRLAFSVGIVVLLLFQLFAAPVSKLFSPDPEVQRYAVLYMRIVALGYGFQGIFTNSVTVLNVLRKPLYAGLLSLTQMFCLYIPLAYLGSLYLGPAAVFAALAFSYVVMGSVSVVVAQKEIGRQLNE
jgi:putative MATE family efflux protein